MKRFFILLITSVIIFSFAGCGYDPLRDTQPTTEATTGATDQSSTEATAEKSYNNNYNGLVEYMKDKGYLDKTDEKNREKMRADLIGAKKGYRYINGSATIELYEYDMKADNKEAKEIRKSVKNNGYYTIYGKKISSYLSDNEKYLMIYVDTAVDGKKESDAYKKQENAIKDFKVFGK